MNKTISLILGLPFIILGLIGFFRDGPTIPFQYIELIWMGIMIIGIFNLQDNQSGE